VTVTVADAAHEVELAPWAHEVLVVE
jgi:hypothetical protein